MFLAVRKDGLILRKQGRVTDQASLLDAEAPGQAGWREGHLMP